MTVCPSCKRKTAEGRFCERCGAELPPTCPEAEAPQACTPVAQPGGDVAPQSPGLEDAEPMAKPVPPPAAPPPAVPPPPPAPPVQAAPATLLEMDTFCILFEELPGFLRFRLNPATTLENVVISVENPLMACIRAL